MHGSSMAHSAAHAVVKARQIILTNIPNGKEGGRMYASGEQAMIGDIVEANRNLGEVSAVTQSGPGGQETATVQWTTPREKESGSGVFALLAPVLVPTHSLRLVSRKPPTHN